MTKRDAIEQQPQSLAADGVAEGRSRHAHTQFPAALSSRNALGACGDDRIA